MGMAVVTIATVSVAPGMAHEGRRVRCKQVRKWGSMRSCLCGDTYGGYTHHYGCTYYLRLASRPSLVWPTSNSVQPSSTSK